MMLSSSQLMLFFLYLSIVDSMISLIHFWPFVDYWIFFWRLAGQVSLDVPTYQPDHQLARGSRGPPSRFLVPVFEDPGALLVGHSAILVWHLVDERVTWFPHPRPSESNAQHLS